MDQDALQAHFAQYVATLGRGPGRSRALTREEACDAFALVLRGAPDPMQTGAFLMLLRYRGEDPDEVTGLIEAARAHAALGRGGLAADFPAVDLDWPSYGAGRTRGAPWFLLAALALAASGTRILMHGSNEFSGGIAVADALAALGRPVQTDLASVSQSLHRDRFAYWPAASMAPRLEALLGLRRLFGLRSPVNTVARLLDPADARASVDGVFHPPYIALHLAVADRLRRPSLLVLKGGGGEAERAPAKPTLITLHRAGEPAAEMLLPALSRPAPRDPLADTASRLRDVWLGAEASETVMATVLGTIAMALLAMRRCATAEQADRESHAVWNSRNPERPATLARSQSALQKHTGDLTI